MIEISNKQLIRKNLRFATYSGVVGGENVFIKEAQQDNLHEHLWREAAGLNEMYELDPAELHYLVPRVKHVGSGTLVSSWVDGTEMKVELLESGEGLRKKHLQTLVGLYAYMDDKSVGSIGITRTNQIGKPNGIDKALERIADLKDKVTIDLSLFDRVGEYTKNLQSVVENRFTHGDMQAGNVLVNDGMVPTIIDCEACSFLWPRHYNIVGLVFNYTFNHQGILGDDLKSSFYEYFSEVQVDPKDSIDQINFIAGVRSLQCIYENLGNYTEDGVESLPEEKNQFLERCMQNILDKKLFIE